MIATARSSMSLCEDFSSCVSGCFSGSGMVFVPKPYNVYRFLSNALLLTNYINTVLFRSSVPQERNETMESMHEQPGAFREIAAQRASFSLAFLGLFAVTFLILASLGLTPDPTVTSADTTSANALSQLLPQGQGEYPVRVVSSAINLDVTVANPTSTDAKTLDALLLKGAVRYPNSSVLGQNGTVLIFGHSSYLPVVLNKAYKTFDGVQYLKPGDTISVYSTDKEYRYTVTSVQMENTSDSVSMDTNGEHLVLVTCDVFGEKTDRWVVSADFVGTYPLTQ